MQVTFTWLSAHPQSGANGPSTPFSVSVQASLGSGRGIASGIAGGSDVSPPGAGARTAFDRDRIERGGIDMWAGTGFSIPGILMFFAAAAVVFGGLIADRRRR